MAILSKILVGLGVVCAGLCIATKMLASWDELLMNKNDVNCQQELPERRFFTKLIRVPTRSIGAIIGKGGLGIRRLEFETRTFIRVIYCDKDGNPLVRNRASNRTEDSLEQEDWFSNKQTTGLEQQETAFVEIRGESKKLIRIACLAIHGLVTDSFVPKVTYHVTVDAHAIGGIIGKDGCNIKQMQRDYKVRIEIENCGTSSMLSITGVEESVQLVERRIWQLMGRRSENALTEEEDRLANEAALERMCLQMVSDEEEEDWGI